MLSLEIARWCEEHLIVPEGPLRGNPYTLDDWQVEFLDGLFQSTTREAGLSVARKNGKSGLIAAVILYFLSQEDGNENWRGIITSMTGLLATELRDQVLKTAKASGIDKRKDENNETVGYIEVLKTPTPGRITGKNNAVVNLLAADKGTGHAVGADLAIIDEAGLMQENQRELWNAIYSCVSGRNGKLCCISIQGDGPMFREMKERQRDESVYWQGYECSRSAALNDVAAWHASNPGLKSGIKSLQYMKDAAQRALSSPANQAAFRAYDLNQPQDPSREMICSLSDWQALESVEYKQEGPVVIGLDIGGARAMTCAVALWVNTGALLVRGAFPEIPPLIERGRADSVGGLYERMQERGELRLLGRRVADVGAFLRGFLSEVSGHKILGIGADRYRENEVLEVLEADMKNLECTFRGTPVESSFDVRMAQRAIIGREISPGDSLMLESAIADSSLKRESNGDLRIDKARYGGRIDALQAFVMACGMRSLVLGGGVAPSVRYAVAG